MKTTKKYLVAGIATTAIIALWVGSTSAMNGQWTWEQAKRWMSEFVTVEQRAEVENMTQENRQEFIQKMRAEHGITNERMWDRGSEKMWDRNSEDMKNNKKVKRDWKSRGVLGEFITEDKKNELRSMSQDERRTFIQNLRVEHGITDERMGDRSGDGEKTWEGKQGKKGSKWDWEGRNK